MTDHKKATLQLVGDDFDSRKLMRDLLKELRKPYFYQLQVSISQALAIGNVVHYNPFSIHIEI